ncbi:hypothetical protein A3K62_00190 [Candidatus Pacearchaeota archaeon RBG_16_35_8]|nr:MAG: hypothetical protein A3K62_00190 [Candidatus Pacearchaeota archaeon RBG_16_35_8]
MKSIIGKRGDILVGDVIFLVLNLVFLSILVIFIVTKTNDSSIVEEKYAKQIALIIDSAKPVMRINLNMEDAIDKAQDANQNIAELVKINGNVVTVKLGEKGGYSYSFFNNVNVSTYLDNSNNKEYVLIINEKNSTK